MTDRERAEPLRVALQAFDVELSSAEMDIVVAAVESARLAGYASGLMGDAASFSNEALAGVASHRAARMGDVDPMIEIERSPVVANLVATTASS